MDYFIKRVSSVVVFFIYFYQYFFQVYMPLLSFNQHKNGDADKSKPSTAQPLSRQSTRMTEKTEDMQEESEMNLAESNAKALLRDEFLINMDKFASSIMRTIQQIEGEV